MKTSKLRNIAWAIFALILANTTVFAQELSDENNMNYKNANCLNWITGLSEEQETQIAAMEEQHQLQMDELRAKRRSTTNAIEKSEIRTTMLKNVEAHRNSVKALLTEDQQKQYDQLHAAGNYGQNQQFANRRGGNRNFAGNGRGNFARGNNGRGCYGNSNFRGRGNGNWNNCRNNFKGRNANNGRGYGRARYQDSGALQ